MNTLCLYLELSGLYNVKTLANTERNMNANRFNRECSSVTKIDHAWLAEGWKLCCKMDWQMYPCLSISRRTKKPVCLFLETL